MIFPEQIEAIGDEIAIRWNDGSEDYLQMERLRAWSPSAENMGERDLVGRQIGGHDGPQSFPGVTVRGWNKVGGYAIQFQFSDGHNTGLYSFDYLKKLGQMARE
ncbi:MAG: DUF971 domain-containing protein [Verrucomicrobiales bacterium]|nr:DUF971 domain-containing protein [Verrucomicrobiales bacterium]MCP5558697.1 DUF971 domain-containing protein [Verrucomicrobiaceae bacterium]